MAAAEDQTVMNAMAELLSWHILRRRFLSGNCAPGHGVNFSYALRGVCSVFPPTTLSLRTKLLLKLVCLVSKLQQPEEELRLDGLQTVVCLLECLQGFPELAGRKKSLQSFRAEAMCQTVLHCYSNNSEAEAIAHWKKYFKSARKSDPVWSLSSQLSALVRSLSGEAANLSQPEVKKFLSQHTFSVFKQELLTFLRSVVESLGEPLLYKGMQCGGHYSTVAASRSEGRSALEGGRSGLEWGRSALEGGRGALEEGQSALEGGRSALEGGQEREPVVEEEPMDVGNEDVGGDKREGVSGGSDKREGVSDGGEKREGVSDGGDKREGVSGGDKREGVSDGGDKREGVSGDGERTSVKTVKSTDEVVVERRTEDAMAGPLGVQPESSRMHGRQDPLVSVTPPRKMATVRPRQLRNRGEGVSEGEAIEWSSEESSDVDTPPSRLPAHHNIVVRRRDSLLAHTGRTRRTPWTAEEESYLVQGVERFGIGRWAKIRSTYNFMTCRTNVDLKDKWRNMRKNR